jgi:phosphoadenosine phosphosulfate reductase
MTAVERTADDLEHLSAQELIAEAVARYPRLAVATSFQKEASVILDLVMKVDPTVRVFTLDTGALFPETRETWARLEEHYGITIEGVRGTLEPRHWERSTDSCCDLRKVKPLRETLADADAWVAGLRRDQSAGRAGTPKLHWDEKHGLWKANPLADWTDKDVWRYIADNDVPYNPLHDRGYSSIGCTHCTLPSDSRDGRWSGTGKLECGLHG